MDLHYDNASLRVTSAGFTVDYGDYELVANFASFSPNSLSELQQLEKIDAGDQATWIIDGGFSDIVIRNASGELVTLKLESEGLALTSETTSAGDLSGIRINGTFSNQVSDFLTWADYYTKFDTTSDADKVTAASHMDDLRAFANGKFELTGISLLREGATEAAAAVSYENDTISLSMDKFKLAATVEDLTKIELTSLDQLDLDFFGEDVSTTAFDSITKTSTIVSHDDHGQLIMTTIEDLNYFESINRSDPLIYGLIDGNYYVADANFALVNTYDFGDIELEMSAFESYVNNVFDLSDIYVEIL